MNPKRLLKIVALPLVSTLAVAQTPNAISTPYLAALNGTYTFTIADSYQYSLQYNSAGYSNAAPEGQVGFCNGILPWTYECFQHLGQSIPSRAFVADGNGDITKGLFMRTTERPYKYSAITAWRESVNYATGGGDHRWHRLLKLSKPMQFGRISIQIRLVRTTPLTTQPVTAAGCSATATPQCTAIPAYGRWPQPNQQ